MNPMLGVNIGAAMATGLENRNAMLEAQRAAEMRDFMRQNGAAIMSGDEAALGQLAGYDPQAALGIQGDRLRMDATRAGIANDAARLDLARTDTMARLEMAREAGARAREEWEAGADTRELEQTTAKLQTTLLKGRQALMSPEAWDTFNDDFPDLENVPYEGAEAALAEIEGFLNGRPALTEVARGATLYDPTTNQPVFTAPFEPDSPPSEVGTIPPEMELITDPVTGARRLRRIPSDVAEAEAAATGNRKNVAVDTISSAARAARDAAFNAPGILPTTGTLGGIASNLSETNAAEVRRQVAVLTSLASLENLAALRAAGGTLGPPTDKDAELLRNAAGALDPNAGPERFAAQLDAYERKLLEVTIGPEAAERVWNERRTTTGDDDLDSILERWR